MLYLNLPIFTDKFSINSQSGIFKLVSGIDYETPPTDYTITVTVTDGGIPSLTATAVVYISVLDVNDNSPVITDPINTKSISIYEVH